MPSLDLHQSKSLALEVLHALGVSDVDALTIWQTMEYADARGKSTHGVSRLPLYCKNVQAGTIDPQAKPELVMDAGAVAVVDAHNGFGQVAAKYAVERGIEKARQHGVAAIGVRNSNNFGAAGFFGLLCAQQGMACLGFANAAPAFAPTGGEKPVLGTNPLCYAAPGAQDLPPVVLDMAVTQAARSKIRLAAKNGEPIPEGWATDSQGNPTTNAKQALEGLLLPIGGPKGYGLGLMADMMAGLLTGSAYVGDVKPLSSLDGPSRNGHFFIVLNVAAFCSQDEYCQRYHRLVEALRASGEEVRLPGEHQVLATEVSLSPRQYEELMACKSELLAQKAEGGSL